MDSEDSNCNDEACFNKCHNTLTSKWKRPCEFEPYGDNIFNCVNTCVTKNNCDYLDVKQNVKDVPITSYVLG